MNTLIKKIDFSNYQIINNPNPFSKDLSSNNDTIHKESELLKLNSTKKSRDEVQNTVLELNKNNFFQNIDNQPLSCNTSCEAPKNSGLKNLGKDALIRLIEEVTGIDFGAIPDVIDILDFISNGIKGKMGTCGKEFVDFATKTIEKLKQTFKNLKSFKDGFKVPFQVVAAGINFVTKFAKSVIGTLIEGGGRILRKIFGEKAGNAIGKVLSTITKPVKFLFQLAGKGIKKVAKGLKFVGQKILNVFKKMGTGVKKIGQKIVNGVKKVGKTIVKGFKKIGNFFKRLFKRK